MQIDFSVADARNALEQQLIRYCRPFDGVLLRAWKQVRAGLEKLCMVDASQENLQQPCSLELFIQQQSDRLGLVMEFLKNELRCNTFSSDVNRWTPVVVELLEHTDLLRVRIPESMYWGSPLCKFFKLLEVLMGGSLWQLVQNSLNEYVSLFEQYSLSSAPVVDSALITLNTVAPGQYINEAHSAKSVRVCSVDWDRY